MSGSRVRLAVLGSAAALAISIITPGLALADPAARPQPPTFSWVALGDSYTAGVIKAAGHEFQTPRDGCVRTNLSYPEVVARSLGSRVNLTNVSCGNATIENVTTVGQFPIGTQIPGLSTDPDYPFPQVPIQLDAVQPDTSLVTVGIGGNSLGFGEILNTCLALGKETGDRGTPCKSAYVHDDLGDESMNERFTQLAAEYGQMLTMIRAKAPNAKILTVGYPFIIPDHTARCSYGSLLGFYTITHGDLDWLRSDVLERLNSVIQRVTAGHGDTYLNIYDSSRGHSVCDKAGGENWVDGIFSSLTSFEPALVHPNAKGQANAATQVEEAILAVLGQQSADRPGVRGSARGQHARAARPAGRFLTAR